MFRYEFMLKETHVQAWMVVHALINGYGRTQPGCRDDLLAFLFQLSYCKVHARAHANMMLNEPQKVLCPPRARAPSLSCRQRPGVPGQ